MTATRDETRCSWCGEDPEYVRYHDEEWGVPSRDEAHLFEMLLLEGAQAGLSWITILRKREAYRELFFNFDPERIANLNPVKKEQLMQDPRIVRNRLKINAFVKNSIAWLKMRDESGSFSDWLWGFVDDKPIVNHFATREDVPAITELATTVSKELKARGFTFVGPTIIYAYLQSVGIVNDHVTSCFRHPDRIKSLG